MTFPHGLIGNPGTKASPRATPFSPSSYQVQLNQIILAGFRFPPGGISERIKRQNKEQLLGLLGRRCSLAAWFGQEVGGAPEPPLSESHVFTSWGKEEQGCEFPAPVPVRTDQRKITWP